MMRKRERENPCGVCGHYHKFEEGEVCGICGHRVPVAAEKTPVQVSAFPSEIVPEFLYLGSYDNASRSELLKTQGISRVLNTVPACQNLYKNSFTYHYLQDEKTLQFDDANQFLEIPARLDNGSLPSVQICIALLNFLSNGSETVFNLVEQCERDKARVLVHCMSGKNRSPAIVIAYLMKSRGWRLAQSYQWVKERRPVVELNQATYQQLQEYEEMIFGSTDSSNPTAPVFPSVTAPLFSFGFPRADDPLPIPAFNNVGATSVFARPALDTPQEFTFGANQPQNNISGNVFSATPPNSNASDIPMDSS